MSPKIKYYKLKFLTLHKKWPNIRKLLISALILLDVKLFTKFKIWKFISQCREDNFMMLKICVQTVSFDNFKEHKA